MAQKQTFAECLKRLRRRSRAEHRTMTDLAVQVGVQRQDWYGWESGDKVPPLGEKIIKIGRVLGLERSAVLDLLLVAQAERNSRFRFNYQNASRIVEDSWVVRRDPSALEDWRSGLMLVKNCGRDGEAITGSTMATKMLDEIMVSLNHSTLRETWLDEDIDEAISLFAELWMHGLYSLCLTTRTQDLIEIGSAYQTYAYNNISRIKDPVIRGYITFNEAELAHIEQDHAKSFRKALEAREMMRGHSHPFESFAQRLIVLGLSELNSPLLEREIHRANELAILHPSDDIRGLFRLQEGIWLARGLNYDLRASDNLAQVADAAKSHEPSGYFQTVRSHMAVLRKIHGAGAQGLIRELADPVFDSIEGRKWGRVLEHIIEVLEFGKKGKIYLV